MKTIPFGQCACGMPLHYPNFATKKSADRNIEQSGEFVVVECGADRYRVQRHYIALHGLAAADLPELARRGIIEAITPEPEEAAP